MKRWQWQVAAAILLLGAGVALDHYLLPDFISTQQDDTPDTTQSDTSYTFINPLLFCNDQAVSNYTDALSAEMSGKLQTYIDSQESQGSVVEASVYYKDLNDGPWVLLNGTMKTVPASLLKVPTAIALYKHAESDPGFLTRSFTIDKNNTSNNVQYFTPKAMIEPGSAYTVEDLIHYMLQDSDNAALYALGATLPANEFKDSYKDLGIDIPSEDSPDYTIGARTYASFFRVLFNASYLTKDDSEHLLSILSGSSFNQGLRAGIPPGITVADKFGESSADPSNLYLNDCGIVYRTNDPYILCVITRGQNFDTLADTIAGISLVVWQTLEEYK